MMQSPRQKRKTGATMTAIEERFGAFRNQLTYWRHSEAGTLDRFNAAYEEGVDRVRSEVLGMDVPIVIDGEEIETGNWVDNVSPADKDLVVCRSGRADAKLVKKAIAVAKAAEKPWARTPWQDRCALLEKAADLYEEHFYDLCAIMTFEAGKTRYEASIDVDEAIDFLRFYALVVREMNGFDQAMGSPVPSEKCRSIMKPYGTFAVICPFNFPVAITTGMTAAALVAGNPVIMKPSAKGTLSGYRCFQLLEKAGFPSGVLQFLVGAAKELSEDPDVKGVAFTGSRKIGTDLIVKRAKETPGGPIVAEMGGKNATIVTASADLDKAVDGCYRAAFGFQGQKCSATSRIIVDRRVKDAFVKKLVAKTSSLVVDYPWKEEAYMGPIIEAKKLEEYHDWVKKARTDGRILTGGEAPKGLADKGWYVRPTIVDGLPPSHPMFKTELFMPIVSLHDCNGVEEAVDLLNATQYGLTAGIITEDADEAQYFFDNAECGVLYHNRRAGSSTAAVVNGQSFGGWKDSGHTGIHAGGRWYLLQFVREQSQTRVVE